MGDNVAYSSVPIELLNDSWEKQSHGSQSSAVPGHTSEGLMQSSHSVPHLNTRVCFSLSSSNFKKLDVKLPSFFLGTERSKE